MATQKQDVKEAEVVETPAAAAPAPAPEAQAPTAEAEGEQPKGVSLDEYLKQTSQNAEQLIKSTAEAFGKITNLKETSDFIVNTAALLASVGVNKTVSITQWHVAEAQVNLETRIKPPEGLKLTEAVIESIVARNPDVVARKHDAGVNGVLEGYLKNTLEAANTLLQKYEV